MTDTNTGLNFRQRLLAGSLDATDLETELADDNKKASFNAMINNYGNAQKLFENETSFLNIFGSATAWAIVKTSSGAIDAIVESLVATKIAVENSDIIQEILQSANFYNSLRKSSFQTLKLHINNSYSKLKRQVFYSTGSFIPAVNIALVCSLLIAGGGGGGSYAGFLTVHGGGGGGEMKVDFVSSLVAGTYAVTVGAGGGDRANGSNSVFQSITANGGESGYYLDGTPPNPAGTGGGTTTNGGLNSLFDVDIENAVWHLEALSIKGGKGAETGVNDAEFFKKLGGIPFTTQLGEAGTGLLGGGNLQPTATTDDGLNGIANSGNGGGAAGNNSGGTGGTGGSGLVILYYIEA